VKEKQKITLTYITKIARAPKALNLIEIVLNLSIPAVVQEVSAMEW